MLSSSSLQFQSAFFEEAHEKPAPEFFGDIKFQNAWGSLRSHPHINRLLDQLWRKDPYTYGHSHRVANYAQACAQELGLNSQERLEVYLAGLFHDIGKIFTPDYVLKKPGPLTPEEFSIMKLHPSDSERIFSTLKDVDHLCPTIRSHHERIDGKGYPHQIKGDKIPVYARVILVADTFDAMTSTRVYRKQLDLSRTYDELIQCSGTQFDPDFSKAFIAVHQKWMSLGKVSKAA